MTDTKIVVTIDGPAGSGKSTVADRVAKAIDGVHLNTGLVYRAATLVFIKHYEYAYLSDFANWVYASLELTLEDGIVTEILSTPISIEELSSPIVSASVSKVSAQDSIRRWANQIFANVADSTERPIVCDGRDAGSTIFPTANLKIYLTASTEIRSIRCQESANRLNLRDISDSQKSTGRLISQSEAAENGYCLIDSTKLQLNQVVDLISTHPALTSHQSTWH